MGTLRMNDLSPRLIACMNAADRAALGFSAVGVGDDKGRTVKASTGPKKPNKTEARYLDDFLCGERGQGKNLMSNVVISRLLGGHVDAADYLTGQTRFSRGFFESALWTMDDVTPLSDAAQFEELLGAFIEQLSEKQEAWSGTATRLMTDLAGIEGFGPLLRDVTPVKIGRLLAKLEGETYLSFERKKTARVWQIDIRKFWDREDSDVPF